MTYEEALIRFKAFSEFCDDRNEACDRNCDKCVAMDVAIIEALEKQIPKKPINYIIRDYCVERIRRMCPTCGKAVEVEDNEGYGHEYYPACKCGQIIDWTGICEGKWNDYEEVEKSE